MSISTYRELRNKGFRAAIALEIAKMGKRIPVFPREEFALPTYSSGTPHAKPLTAKFI
jgi:hypothetical protein